MTEARPAPPSAIQPTPPAAVLRLATAYQASRALHVAAGLGLPDLLADGPRPAEDLAAATGAHTPSLRRLLRALAAFGVFAEGEDGGFALGPLGECLRAGAPGSVRALVLMYGHEDYWHTWGELEHCVRTGETAVEHLFGAGDAFARYAADPALGAAMNEGLTVLSATVAQAVVAAYNFSAAGPLVDVGGGQGQLLAAILRANPTLLGTLFDLPSVVEGAPRVLAEAGVADRCEVIGGDIFAGVPAGGGLYLLSRVLNSFDDERAAAVLASCRRAMGEGGAKLLLAERVLPERVEPTPAIQSRLLADLNMLVRTGGRDRSEAEFREMLAAAGLRLERVVPTAGPVSLVEAALQ
jgi:O-methyltransferase domain/Dimerisation domain